MIRAFYNFNSTPLYHTENNHSDAMNKSGQVVGNINKVRNDAAISIDPHANLKKGIVFDKGCYSHLRSVSCYAMDDLFSSVFHSGPSKSSNISTLSSELVYEKSIIDSLLREIKITGDIIQSLQHVHVGRAAGFDNGTEITTKYLSHRRNTDCYWSGLILFLCRDEIIRSSHQLVNPELEQQVFLTPDGQKEWHRIGLKIAHVEIDRYTLNSIFSAFNKVFNENKTNAKFIMALIAFYLRNHWAQIPPDNIKTNNLTACSSQYSELLATGKIIADLLARDDLKISIDKQLAFLYWHERVNHK